MWSTQEIYDARSAVGSVSRDTQPIIFCVLTDKNGSIWLKVDVKSWKKQHLKGPGEWVAFEKGNLRKAWVSKATSEYRLKKAFVALIENPGSVPSSHMSFNNWL